MASDTSRLSEINQFAHEVIKFLAMGLPILGPDILAEAAAITSCIATSGNNPGAILSAAKGLGQINSDLISIKKMMDENPTA